MIINEKLLCYSIKVLFSNTQWMDPILKLNMTTIMPTIQSFHMLNGKAVQQAALRFVSCRCSSQCHARFKRVQPSLANEANKKDSTEHEKSSESSEQLQLTGILSVIPLIPFRQIWKQ